MRSFSGPARRCLREPFASPAISSLNPINRLVTSESGWPSPDGAVPNLQPVVPVVLLYSRGCRQTIVSIDSDVAAPQKRLLPPTGSPSAPGSQELPASTPGAGRPTRPSAIGKQRPAPSHLRKSSGEALLDQLLGGAGAARPVRRVSAEGLTYDTGALVAAERNDRLVWSLHRAALHEASPTVPAAVLAEGWRGGHSQHCPGSEGLSHRGPLRSQRAGRRARSRSARAQHDDIVDVSVSKALYGAVTRCHSNPTHMTQGGLVSLEPTLAIYAV